MMHETQSSLTSTVPDDSEVVGKEQRRKDI